MGISIPMHTSKLHWLPPLPVHQHKLCTMDVVRHLGSRYSVLPAERRPDSVGLSAMSKTVTARYTGHIPWWTECIVVRSLCWMRWCTGNQCNYWRNSGVRWSRARSPSTRRAAAAVVVDLGKPAKTVWVCAKSLGAAGWVRWAMTLTCNIKINFFLQSFVIIAVCLDTVYGFFSERELKFMFAICHRRSVCLSVVCNVGAPYSGDWNFRQYFYAIWYLGHPWPFYKKFYGDRPRETPPSRELDTRRVAE